MATLKFDRAIGYVPGIGQVVFKELEPLGYGEYAIVVELATDYKLPEQEGD